MRRVTSDLIRFYKEEAGNISVFSVMMLLIMMLIAGASVDIMRREALRAGLQSAMDRAVLAAADLDQKQKPKLVVEDYMKKAGLGNALTNVVVDPGLNFRTVTATGKLDMSTVFLRMSGFDKLKIPVVSAAEEKISNVEVSLVLDVSGSMADYNRLTNMKTAAKSFVQTVIQPPQEGSGLTSVSVVPYNSTVNLGPQTAPYFNLAKTHDYSHCAMFEDADFKSVAMNPSRELRRMGHFDVFTHSWSENPVKTPLCGGSDPGSVMVHNTNVNQLKNRIDNFSAAGGTAIHVGVKWGAAFLDDSTAGVVSAMADAKLTTNNVKGRPAKYTDPEAIKFIVMMTDGANTEEYDLKPSLRSGMSDIFVDERGTASYSDDRYSVLVRDSYGSHNDLYFHDRRRHSDWNPYRNYPDGGSNARRLSKAEAFHRFGTNVIARRFLRPAYYDGHLSWSTYNEWANPWQSVASGQTVDNRLTDICTAAKAKGIVIFAIAFEAPQSGKEDLLACASSPSHFFDVNGVEITETFHAIARQINSLRLIQ